MVRRLQNVSLHSQHLNQRKEKEGEKNSRLRPINSIKSLVQKQTHSPSPIDPSRTILIHIGRVVKHGSNIGYHESEAGQGDLHTFVLSVT